MSISTSLADINQALARLSQECSNCPAHYSTFTSAGEFITFSSAGGHASDFFREGQAFIPTHLIQLNIPQFIPIIPYVCRRDLDITPLTGFRTQEKIVCRKPDVRPGYRSASFRREWLRLFDRLAWAVRGLDCMYSGLYH